MTQKVHFGVPKVSTGCIANFVACLSHVVGKHVEHVQTVVVIVLFVQGMTQQVHFGVPKVSTVCIADSLASHAHVFGKMSHALEQLS